MALFSFDTLKPGEKDQGKLFQFFKRISGVLADKDDRADLRRSWHERLMDSLMRAQAHMVPVEGPDDLAPAYVTNENE
jgi:hypothetical protein